MCGNNDTHCGSDSWRSNALETLILPQKAPENERLLLTRAYKERLLEAFKAIVTKTRETHGRQLGPAIACDNGPRRTAKERPTGIRPRLRVEPNPTYYLRCARAYGFVQSLLETQFVPALKQLHGLKQDGQRDLSLADELRQTRELCYGLYLVSAEDIGLKPEFLAGESVDLEACYQRATVWLVGAFTDPDVKADTRVAVNVYLDRPRNRTRVWLTLGVRMAKLVAWYPDPDRVPRIRAAETAPWEKVERWKLEKSDYLIAGEDFAEVELNGIRALSRDELRAICDKHRTREEILKSLR